MPQKKRCHHRDERDYSSDFHKNDSRIEVRRFAYSDHQNRGDDGDDQACREVQYAPRVRQGARIDTRFCQSRPGGCKRGPPAIEKHHERPWCRRELRRNMNIPALEQGI